MATRRPPDDSEEEEATAIDLRSSSQAFKPSPHVPKAAPSSPSAPSAPSSSSPSSPAQPVVKRASKPLHRSEGDEEATEFLAMRPSSSGVGEPASSPSSLRARGRAVPLEGEASTPAAVAPERKSRESPPSEKLVERPDAEAPAPLPSRTPRPLPGERQTNVKSETQSGASGAPAVGAERSAAGAKAAPRITRIFSANATHDRIGTPDESSRTDPGEDDEVTDPPMPRYQKPIARPLPGSADQIASADVVKGAPARPAPRPATIVVHGTPDDKRTDERSADERRSKTARTPAPSSETLEAEPADGTLIVEVPDGATIFVNGIERGKGPSLKVTRIDRYAKHAVRIHAPGYAPWSGSVCLEGRTAAKIRPGLKAKK